MKRLFTVALVLAGALTLTACDTVKDVVPEEVVKTFETKVLVPVPCPVEIDPAPVYPDSDAALAAVPHPDAAARVLADPADPVARHDLAENIFYQAKLVYAGRDLRDARIGELEAGLEVCRAAGGAKP